MLYVVSLPDPPAGTDFTFVVPGINVYDVVGITAQLLTHGGAVTVMHDSSGNGNDGQYVNLRGPGFPPIFIPGLVAGDNALQASDPGPQFRTSAFVNTNLCDGSADFTVAWWTVITADMAGANLAAWDFDTNTPSVDVQAQYVPGPAGFFELDAGFLQHWQTANGTIPADGLPHFDVVTWNHAAKVLTFYRDGAVVPWTMTGVNVMNTAADFFDIGANNLPHTFDEFVTFRSLLSGANVAALYAAGLAGFAGWTAAVLALTPTGFYHLDDTAPGTGRQPTLVVSNGTTELEAIPTGFPAVSTPGPYDYSWQPGLNADIQSQDGTLTTVAIPRLILSGGYRVGTRTLDLQSTDQWSNVNLWWNSDVQDAVKFRENYRYPPGVWLRYQKAGATA